MQLIQVQDDDSWKAYHSIRRRVLYELRGRYDYDETHPDEYREGHFPLLFNLGEKPVGTTRLDTMSEAATIGTVRLVAVLPQYQRRGIGRAMMDDLERFAATKGIRQLNVYAAQDAVSFYEKLGWQLIDAARQSPLLSKIIL
ncbi:GNAT family N-acetyltransferase [Rhizobium puerariae]|uniref:GNAT family N-acetyltransferase n=1 Tax=Rhizobium puerariae TaxID=1585791 RepID=A0ABV6AE65_9HYPH